MPKHALDDLQSWYDRWINPVLGEVYKKNVAAAEALLSRARIKVDAQPATPDIRAARQLICHRTEYYIQRLTAFPHGIKELYQKIRWVLDSANCPGPVSEITRARLLLQILTSADRDGIWELSEGRFRELLGKIPPADRSPELWFEVANWLFDHNYPDLLAEAYEVMLDHPMRIRQFPFRRVKLMYLIRKGTVTTGDILEYLRYLQYANAAYEFTHFIWPVLEELHIGTEEVRREMDHTMDRLSKAPRQSPFDPEPTEDQGQGQ